MRKDLLITALFLFISCISYSQLPSVVSAPVLEAKTATQTTILTGLSGTLSAIQASGEIVQDIQEKTESVMKSVDWIWEVNAFAEYLSMVETIVCTTHDLQTNLAIYIELDLGNSCYEEVKYAKGIETLQTAVDVTSIFLDGNKPMSNGERTILIMEAIDKYMDAQLTLFELNVDLIKAIKRASSRETKKKQFDDMYGLLELTY